MLVSSIMEDQYQYVGASMQESSYRDKMDKDGAAAGRAIAAELIERYKNAQEKVRQADEDIQASKQRATKAGFFGKGGELLKRGGYNAKKLAALASKKLAENSIANLIAALTTAMGSRLVNDDKTTTLNTLNELITTLKESKTRTGGVASQRGPPPSSAEPDDDQYGSSSHHSKANWSY